jgi:hypothetical protein
MPLRKDPILSWQTRARSLRREADPHKALKKYRHPNGGGPRGSLDEAHDVDDAPRAYEGGLNISGLMPPSSKLKPAKSRWRPTAAK